MKTLYYKLYFHIYSLALRAQGTDAGLFSTFYLSFIMFIYIMSMIALLGKLDIIHIFPGNKYVSLLYGVILFSINYMIFMRKKRYLEIISQFPERRLKEKIISAVYVLILTVGSLIVLFKVINFKPGYL